MGTSPGDGSVYETRSPRYDGKTDHFFDEAGSHDQPHGHVVESRTSTPSATRPARSTSTTADSPWGHRPRR
jgi:hypothetical protein